MANTLLTTDMIADKALDILTQKLCFIPSINRSYDNSFAQTGGKIGDTLHVRVPQHGVIRKGRVMDPSPLVDVTTPVVIAQQWGQDLNYSSAELALDIDEFAERYMDQRIADLAVGLDAYALQTIATAVPSQTGDPALGMADLFWPLMAGKLLTDQLAMGDRNMLLNTAANVQIVKSLSGLFNSQEQISKQYVNGSIGNAAGFNWKTTTVMPNQTSGTFAGTPLINGAGQTGSSIVTDGWTASSAVLNAGDIIMFAGVNAVHAQTKQDLGYLQQFVVTANVVAAASGTTTIPVSPALQSSGANQNVTGSPADNAEITTVAAAGGTTYGLNLAYTKDIGTFVTADLPIPPRKDAARRVYDGISLRVISDFDTINDAFLTRVDVLFGSAILRPQFGVRVANNPALLTPPT